jgi:hypothetical protein
MSKVAEKILKFGSKASLILEFAFGPSAWVIVPSLIYFPPGSPDGIGGNYKAHDFTLAWLRFGITLRVE